MRAKHGPKDIPTGIHQSMKLKITGPHEWEEERGVLPVFYWS